MSLKHEIENRKTDYYRVLRSYQSNHPNENISEWAIFFLKSLTIIPKHLMSKLEIQNIDAQLSPREKPVIVFTGNLPGCKSGEIAKKLGIPNPTVKRI